MRYKIQPFMSGSDTANITASDALGFPLRHGGGDSIACWMIVDTKADGSDESALYAFVPSRGDAARICLMMNAAEMLAGGWDGGAYNF